MALEKRKTFLVADSLYWRTAGLHEPGGLLPGRIETGTEQKVGWPDIAGVCCPRHTSPGHGVYVSVARGFGGSPAAVLDRLAEDMADDARPACLYCDQPCAERLCRGEVDNSSKLRVCRAHEALSLAAAASLMRCRFCARYTEAAVLGDYSGEKAHPACVEEDTGKVCYYYAEFACVRCFREEVPDRKLDFRNLVFTSQPRSLAPEDTELDGSSVVILRRMDHPYHRNGIAGFCKDSRLLPRTDRLASPPLWPNGACYVCVLHVLVLGKAADTDDTFRVCPARPDGQALPGETLLTREAGEG